MPCYTVLPPAAYVTAHWTLLPREFWAPPCPMTPRRFREYVLAALGNVV